MLPSCFRRVFVVNSSTTHKCLHTYTSETNRAEVDNDKAGLRLAKVEDSLSIAKGRQPPGQPLTRGRGFCASQMAGAAKLFGLKSCVSSLSVIKGSEHAVAQQ